MQARGPWRIRSSEQIYHDDFVDLTLDQVIRPDGNDGQHVIVRIKPGVCVLALDDQNNVILTSEFHYAVGRDSIECVSGGIEPGETAEQTAHRELREELGIIAGRWTRLSTIDPFTTIMESPTCLFVAEQLTPVATNPEGTETIRPVTLPLETAAEWVTSGRITHAPSCVLILMTRLRMSNSREPSEVDLPQV